MFWIVLCVVIVAGCLLLHFNEAVRERARRHEDDWGPARIPGPSGLSDFQQTADERLRATLAAGGLAVAERRLVDLGEPHAHIEERVARTPLTVWLYSDMAVIGGPDTELLLEEWDADTPAALADAVAAHVARLAGGAPA
jgi:hypothetical protein